MVEALGGREATGGREGLFGSPVWENALLLVWQGTVGSCQDFRLEEGVGCWTVS